MAQQGPFRMIPDAMISDHGLCSGAKLLYVAMKMLARNEELMTGFSVAEISKAAGIEEASFRRFVADLEETGWISRSKKQSRYFEVAFLKEWPYGIGHQSTLSRLKREAEYRAKKRSQSITSDRVENGSHSITEDRVDDHQRSSARSPAIECATTPPISLEKGEIRRESDASHLGSAEGRKPRKKKRGRTIPVAEFPLLDSAPVHDDPETAKLVAEVHALILKESGDETMAKWMDGRCRYWREQNAPCPTIL